MVYLTRTTHFKNIIYIYFMERKAILGISIAGFLSIILSKILYTKDLSTLEGSLIALVLVFTIARAFQRFFSDKLRAFQRLFSYKLRSIIRIIVYTVEFVFLTFVWLHFSVLISDIIAPIINHFTFIIINTIVLFYGIMLYIKSFPELHPPINQRINQREELLINPIHQDRQTPSPLSPNQMQNSEKKNITNMFRSEDLKSLLNEYVIGQSYAKTEIINTIIFNIKKQKRLKKTSPILGTFFFVGPTGVGKTETSKAIAKYFEKFGYQYLRFDMGNFSDSNTASTLVGSPKGYVGSEEGGALTRPLMENPRAVILFDEMEKGHPSLFKTFMALIDEGEIQEVSTGKRVKLDQAIIIFTSNLYQEAIVKAFEVINNEIEREKVIRDILSGNVPEVFEYFTEKYKTNNTTSFPPEFVGRIDKIVPFVSLSYQDYFVIVRKLAIKYGVSVDPKALTDKYIYIAETYGVRQFVKKIEEEIIMNN
ncbi:MAG: AAA family ATPase [Thermoplasmata archaeon]